MDGKKQKHLKWLRGSGLKPASETSRFKRELLKGIFAGVDERDPGAHLSCTGVIEVGRIDKIEDYPAGLSPLDISEPQQYELEPIRFVYCADEPYFVAKFVNRTAFPLTEVSIDFRIRVFSDYRYHHLLETGPNPPLISANGHWYWHAPLASILEDDNLAKHVEQGRLGRETVDNLMRLISEPELEEVHIPYVVRGRGGVRKVRIQKRPDDGPDGDKKGVSFRVIVSFREHRTKASHSDFAKFEQWIDDLELRKDDERNHHLMD